MPRLSVAKTAAGYRGMRVRKGAVNATNLNVD